MAAIAVKAVEDITAWEIGTTRLFGNYDLGSAGMLSGWAPPEDPHNWNDGPEASLQVILSGAVRRALKITIEGSPFIGGNTTFQDLTLYVNGARIGFWRLTQSKSYTLTAVVESEHLFERGSNTVLNCAFYLPMSVKPADISLGKDTRALGFCFRSIAIA
jgi:hypothetical protein